MQTASLQSELETESPRYILGSFRLPLFLKRQVRRAKPQVFGTVEVVQISFKTEVSSSRKGLELRAYLRSSGGMSLAALPFLNLLKTCLISGADGKNHIYRLIALGFLRLTIIDLFRPGTLGNF